MFKAAVITEYGGSKVLQVKKVNARKILENEVLVKHDFVGINYYDVKQRKGIIRTVGLPMIVGCEGVGTIEEVSLNERNFKVGHKVCYVNAPSGAYSEKRVISTKYLIPILDNLALDILAASLHKILTAYVLMFRAFLVKKNMIILVHDACGNIGRFIAQLGNILGCKIIGTVKSEEYYESAQQFGCDLVLNYNDPNMYKSVLEYTGGKGVSAVYDPIDKKSISLHSLAMFGLYVVYEQNFGIVQNISWKSLNSRSLFFAAPSFFHYQNEPIQRILDVKEIFELFKQKKLKCQIGKKYSLEEAGHAQDDLENCTLSAPGIIVI